MREIKFERRQHYTGTERRETSFGGVYSSYSRATYSYTYFVNGKEYSAAEYNHLSMVYTNHYHQFASDALKGLLAGRGVCNAVDINYFVSEAYHIADAMVFASPVQRDVIQVIPPKPTNEEQENGC